jgi:hypothetical protein
MIGRDCLLLLFGGRHEEHCAGAGGGSVIAATDGLGGYNERYSEAGRS